ncbi:hypothetical protein JYQ62_22110 [Nostoc sp. UHCC 0702]|nr:hypothetical protein JYQ62_22110 [Nostoc sp. UHCC 0702]
MGFKRNQAGINELKGQIQEAFALTMGVLDLEFDDVIESDNAFADRGFVNWDIVDTGRFLKSKTIASPSPNLVRWEWNPKNPKNSYPYAAALYTGFMAFGKQYIPGRPWTDRAIERVNVPEWMAFELWKMGIRARWRSD